MAAEKQYHNELIIGTLSDNVALPNATSATTTSMVYIGAGTNPKAKIKVYANTAISIAATKVLHIDIIGYTSDTVASATDIYADADATYRILNMTAVGEAVTWADKALITEAEIPLELMRAKNYDYVALRITTTDDESSEYYSAFVVAEG